MTSPETLILSVRHRLEPCPCNLPLIHISRLNRRASSQRVHHRKPGRSHRTEGTHSRVSLQVVYSQVLRLCWPNEKLVNIIKLFHGEIHEENLPLKSLKDFLSCYFFCLSIRDGTLQGPIKLFFKPWRISND